MTQTISSPVWTTKEGVKIPVKRMTYNHLKNTFKMLQRHSNDIDFAIDTMPDNCLPATAFEEQRIINYWLRVIKGEIEVRERFKYATEEGTFDYENCF